MHLLGWTMQMTQIVKDKLVLTMIGKISYHPSTYDSFSRHMFNVFQKEFPDCTITGNRDCSGILYKSNVPSVTAKLISNLFVKTNSDVVIFLKDNEKEFLQTSLLPESLYIDLVKIAFGNDFSSFLAGLKKINRTNLINLGFTLRLHYMGIKC